MTKARSSSCRLHATPWIDPIRSACLLATAALGIVCSAQCDALDSASLAYKELWDGRWENDSIDEQGERYLADMLLLLGEQATFSCALDSTSHLVDSRSEDNMLRVIAWDHFSGGSYHDMVSLAQYRTSFGAVRAATLCGIGGGGEHGLDSVEVAIHAIHALAGNERTMYLLLGWGTRGGGSHHCTALVYGFEGTDLSICEHCLPGGGAYEVETSRGNEIQMRYDPASLTLSHNEFIYTEEEIPWTRPTGDRVELKWNGSAFVPKR